MSVKYSYAYKTSDGTRHEASIEAESREAVFAALRERGIKAIKVVAADGSKANGEIRGVRKRVVVAVTLVVALIAGVVSFLAGERGSHQTPETAPRHQIYGDPVLMEVFDRGALEKFLPSRFDQMLAWFAQPGKLMCPKGTDPRRAAPTFAAEYETNSPPPLPTPTDPREVRELKQIVRGMREELAAYLANGNGTPRSYYRRLLERTQQEFQIYERTRRELEKETNSTTWEEKNDSLRRLGLRTIPNPKDPTE